MRCSIRRKPVWAAYYLWGIYITLLQAGCIQFLTEFSAYGKCAVATLHGVSPCKGFLRNKVLLFVQYRQMLLLMSVFCSDGGTSLPWKHPSEGAFFMGLNRKLLWK